MTGANAATVDQTVAAPNGGGFLFGGHLLIEDLVDGLRDALAAGPPSLPPPEPPENPRQITGARGLLEDLRVVRSVPIESVRAAGPAFDDGVTEEELDACGRAAFGLLDRIREPSPSPR